MKQKQVTRKILVHPSRGSFVFRINVVIALASGKAQQRVWIFCLIFIFKGAKQMCSEARKMLISSTGVLTESAKYRLLKEENLCP